MRLFLADFLPFASFSIIISSLDESRAAISPDISFCRFCDLNCSTTNMDCTTLNPSARPPASRLYFKNAAKFGGQGKVSEETSRERNPKDDQNRPHYCDAGPPDRRREICTGRRAPRRSGAVRRV
ncbi:hypothetical protein AUN14_08140 [Cronobacter muytjensii]|uniref:Uncharacterized protein n=1 Tax=Cronobacter muytjensii TaxID=413501 RepID=A0A2T7AUJ5_9ENTR|nr:hypothetical protein AUN14_08140 [Cronobacter muytjensii]